MKSDLVVTIKGATEDEQGAIKAMLEMGLPYMIQDGEWDIREA